MTIKNPQQTLHKWNITSPKIILLILKDMLILIRLKLREYNIFIIGKMWIFRTCICNYKDWALIMLRWKMLGLDLGRLINKMVGRFIIMVGLMDYIRGKLENSKRNFSNKTKISNSQSKDNLITYSRYKLWVRRSTRRSKSYVPTHNPQPK